MTYILIGIVAVVSFYFVLFSKLIMGHINYIGFFTSIQYLMWGFLIWPIIIPLIFIAMIIANKKK